MRKTASLAAVILIACVAGCTETRLLLVTQYPDGSPRVERMTRAIAQRFDRERAPYQLSVFNMNTLSRPNDIWRDSMAHMAVVRVHAINPHVVFVAGDDAARYFAQRLVDMPRKFIFFDVKADPADYRLASSINVTGVREKLDVQGAFKLMKKFVPYARRAAVIADRSLQADAVLQQIRAESELAIPVVAVRRVGTLAEWRDAISDLQDKADVLCIASYSSVLATSHGYQAVPPGALLSITAKINRLPDFSFWKDAVGPNGVMAAATVPVQAQAALAAAMAVRYLYYDEPFETIRITATRDRDAGVSLERAGRLGVTLPARVLTRTPRPQPTSEPRDKE